MSNIYIYTNNVYIYIYLPPIHHKNQPNVGKYSIPYMDPMGCGYGALSPPKYQETQELMFGNIWSRKHRTPKSTWKNCKDCIKLHVLVFIANNRSFPVFLLLILFSGTMEGLVDMGFQVLRARYIT